MFRPANFLRLLLSSLATVCFLAATAAEAPSPGLLFRLSGDKGLEADYAAGASSPNFAYEVDVISDGARGKGIRCKYGQLLSYRAPGNIYAERGTLSFSWRSVDPFTETEFPIFRVAYADHSSWDMVWLRIDYNGHGFDAFVTDVNLARVRVSYKMDKLPSPMEWTHFAFTWDETEGVRLYINGEKAAQKDSTVVLYAGLDQFGPHSRIISPYQVQSTFNFLRGGDIDEICIFDSALGDGDIRTLAGGTLPSPQPVKRDLKEKKWHDEWYSRYGWNAAAPPILKDETTTVRKVGILEAYDLKRWWWKACDGIRETTWPGVYNRSRIVGRNDYFQLPDWDCYSLSGQSVRFNMPEEPWNYVEISGGADGKLALTPNADGTGGREISSRTKGVERTFHSMGSPVTGQTIVFTNNVQETPIGEFDAFNVHSGDAPQGIARLTYTVTTGGDLSNPNLSPIQEYIRGRYMDDERTVMVAMPAIVPYKKPQTAPAPSGKLPIAQILIPSDVRSGKPLGMNVNMRMPAYPSYTWNNMYAGLDGIRVELPAMGKMTGSSVLPFNIQVKDPIWPLRNMIDFSFSVTPGSARTLWLDLRDRILPGDKPLWITLAGGQGFDPSMLEGVKITLVFKEWEEARKEHVADRFTQVRDNYAMIVEELPNSRGYDKYNQFEADMTDLLRIDPSHKEGRNYWCLYNKEQPVTTFTPVEAPAGIPLWAFLQTELLKRYRSLMEWYVDNRQISNGEFGGGLSDDTDFGNFYPPLVLMGCEPEKFRASIDAMMEAIYDQKMLTNGLSTIQTDALHVFEEGVNTIIQVNMMDPGNPKQVERLMEAARGVGERALGVNKAGHTHFRSNYFSATKTAEGNGWATPMQFGFINLAPAILLGEMYGNKGAREQVIAVADGLMAHARVDKNGKMTIDTEINFITDESSPASLSIACHILWAAWKWTGDAKYLRPIKDSGPGGLTMINSNMVDFTGMRPEAADRFKGGKASGSEAMQHLAWQVTGDKSLLEKLYLAQIQAADVMEYRNTEGSLWIDRVVFPIEELQRARLGGVGLQRNKYYPGNAVSWRFDSPRAAEGVAILIPDATTRSFTVELFNTLDRTVEAEMTGWEVLGGKWEMTSGVDANGDGKADGGVSRKSVEFGRGQSVKLSIAPKQSIIVGMKLQGKGEERAFLPDLAIGKDDVKVEGDKVRVLVHNLGDKASKPVTIAIKDDLGKSITQSTLPSIPSPSDMRPRTIEIAFQIPPGMQTKGCSVVIDPDRTLNEIYKGNNVVKLD